MAEMEEYLAFVDYIGRTLDGKYIYRFDFTTDKETVWGEYFHIAPCAIVPNIQPDKNTISKTSKAIFPREMVIASKNYCFSMQDCIDGIIPLIFSEIDDNTLEIKEVPFFLNFGDDFGTVIEKLSAVGITLFDIEEVEHGDESAIDNLIDSMGDDDIDF
jgi:hypothetical protein